MKCLVFSPVDSKLFVNEFSHGEFTLPVDNPIDLLFPYDDQNPELFNFDSSHTVFITVDQLVRLGIFVKTDRVGQYRLNPKYQSTLPQNNTTIPISPFFEIYPFRMDEVRKIIDATSKIKKLA